MGSEDHFDQRVLQEHAVNRIPVFLVQDPHGQMQAGPIPFGVSGLDFVVLVPHNPRNGFSHARLISPDDAKLPIAGILNIRTFFTHDHRSYEA